MKKTLPIIAVVAASLTIGASIAFANKQHFDVINALGDKTSYTIELTASNATGTAVYDSENWCHRFQITGTTKRDGEEFNSDAVYSYFYDYTNLEDAVFTYGGSHILVLHNNTVTYGNCGIYLLFPFSGPAELTSVKAFYYVGDSEELTEEALTPSSGGYLFTYSLPGNSYVTLEKISFKYNC